jgi:hypothetical protein
MALLRGTYDGWLCRLRTLARLLTVAEHGQSGTAGVPLAAEGAERVVGLTWRTDRVLSPAASRFLEFVRLRP